MNQRFLLKIASFSAAFGSIAFLGWYAISPKTCRTVCYIGQGWTCHYLSKMALGLSNFHAAVSLQRSSIQNYEEAERNLPNSALRLLECDEWGTLSAMYLERNDLDRAIECTVKIEDILQSDVKQGASSIYDNQRARCNVFFYHAQLLNKAQRDSEAIEEYKKVIRCCEELIRTKKSDPKLTKILETAREELAQIEHNH